VRESFDLMKNRSFAVLVATAGVIGVMLAFYFGCEGYFLQERVGIQSTEVGSYMAIGQIAEMVVMLLVPLAVAKLGVKNTMIIGALFWAARFGLSILGQPQWLMIATIAFHGFCFGFFFVVAFMFVDKAASRDVKSTAQGLLVFVVYGIGTVIGNLLVGPLRSAFGTNWAAIWAGPFVLTMLAIIAFAALFRPEEIGEAKELSTAAHV
jgi:cyanate permease